MPIMAAQGRSDAKAAARLLASTAKDCLAEPETGPAHAVELNNVYRLLEAYRVNSFFGLERVPKHHHVAETLSVFPPIEQNVREVRDVLERAVAKAFAGQSKDDAIRTIENVLKLVADPELGKPSDEDKKKTVLFFSVVLNHLQPT